MLAAVKHSKTAPSYVICRPIASLKISSLRFATACVVIDVKPETQLARASSRDHNNIQQIQAIMNAQVSRRRTIKMGG